MFDVFKVREWCRDPDIGGARLPCNVFPVHRGKNSRPPPPALLQSGIGIMASPGVQVSKAQIRPKYGHVQVMGGCLVDILERPADDAYTGSSVT